MPKGPKGERAPADVDLWLRNNPQALYVALADRWRDGRICSEDTMAKQEKKPNRRDRKRGAWSGARSNRPQRAGMEPWSRDGGVCGHLLDVFPGLSGLRIQHAAPTFSARLNVNETASATVDGDSTDFI
jgi:hypothetical protein